MVASLLHSLEPPPPRAAWPARLPSPFEQGPPHPLARQAAEALQAELRRGAIRTGDLDVPGGGKMFGVLVVVAPDGGVAALRGFSGMLDRRWQVPGFVPPLFDEAARETFWPAGEAELATIDAELRELTDGDDARHLRARGTALAAAHAATLAELAARHTANKRRRHEARARLGEAAHALDQESRADGAERRRVEAAVRVEREAMAAELATLAAACARLEALRTERSRDLLGRIHDTYRIASARGEVRALRDLFAPHTPPGGAGDCAAPKLFAAAQRAGLRPLALAEVWWGAPPLTGGRIAGVYYPSCRGKCGPILGHMLDGLDAGAAPQFGAGVIGADEPRAVFEDAWLVIVDKPAGLLSVPGRSGQLRDSVQTRLRARYPDAAGPLVVHRLDLDTSGLLLVAKGAATHAALQRGFARREIDKRYVAWLDGEVAGERGIVELPLRGDLEDRPRQIVDPVDGKPAVTEWTVLARAGGRTRVALHPRTGRTHQLRVHAAHPRGLGAAVVGDPLYGRGGDGRMLLHAEALAFVHPETGARVEVVRPAPF